MLKLRDYLAARTAIWRNQIGKDSAMALLRELHESGRELSWLAFATERGGLDEAGARAIHTEVERFEFAVGIKCALKIIQVLSKCNTPVKSFNFLRIGQSNVWHREVWLTGVPGHSERCISIT